MSTTERVRRLDPVGLAQLRAMSDRLDTQLRVGAPAELTEDVRSEAREMATRMAWRWGWAR